MQLYTSQPFKRPTKDARVKSDKYTVSLSKSERSNARVLVVEPDELSRQHIVSCLRRLGFEKISESGAHETAFYKFEGRRFTHLIFASKQVLYPVQEWLEKIFVMNPKIIAIAITDNPRIDDIFSLIIAGCRGFLVKPFSEERIDYAVSLATNNNPLSDKVRKAGEPLLAVLALAVTSIDNLAKTKRHARQFESARPELDLAEETFERTAALMELLPDSKQNDFFRALQRFFKTRSNEPATQLGRLRKKLSEARTKVEQRAS